MLKYAETKLGIDDPVGASSVHGIGGIWGVLAVGIFANDPVPLSTTNGRKGLVHGGGWYLLGIQALTCLCLSVWGVFSCMILLYLINKIVMIRMEVHHELMGADLTEHHIKHPQVGVSRAVSALRDMLNTTDVENIIDVGLNPGHDVNLVKLKNLSKKRRYKFSRMLRDITKNRNFGINAAGKLFPKKSELRTNSGMSTKKLSSSSLGKGQKISPLPTITRNVPPSTMPWLD